MQLPRWLAPLGPDDGGAWRPNLGAFRRLVLLHMAARTFLTLPHGPGAEPLALLVGWATVVAGAAGLLPGVGLWAARCAAPLVAAQIWIQLPNAANHVAVELACLVLLALFDERDDGEAPLLLAGLRAFGAIFFFYTGLQKLLYGYYFRGQFLAFAAGTEDRFGAFFRHLMPAGEYARLRSYNAEVIQEGAFRPRVGAGPYIVDSLAFQALSNAVYAFEMLGAAALCVPRLRTVAALAAVLFVVLVEAGARELTFGLLMVNLLLLFLPGGWNRRLLPACAAAYLYLVAHRLGWVPLFWYAPA
jgi:hypothetical protein